MAALCVSKVTLEIPLFPFIEVSLFLFRVNLTFFFLLCLSAFLFMIKKAYGKINSAKVI